MTSGHDSVLPRLGAAAGQFVAMTLAWILFQRALDLTPLGHHERWSDLILAALLFGLVLAVVEWFLWPRRARRRQTDSRPATNGSTPPPPVTNGSAPPPPA